eukprot:jgi/Chrpa1/3223/Chrysochromulina_OHIO_Genome00013804-RA
MPQTSIAMLVSNGTLRKVPRGGAQDAAIRTTHDFTFDDCLRQLTSYTEKTKELMKTSKIAPALKLFNGSAINDPSKIFALQKVAMVLKEQRIVPLSEAIQIFYDQRQRFWTSSQSTFIQSWRRHIRTMHRPFPATFIPIYRSWPCRGVRLVRPVYPLCCSCPTSHCSMTMS